MAYVPKTIKAQDVITKNIENLFLDRIELAREVNNFFPETELTDLLYAALIPVSEQEKMNQIDPEYFNWSDRITLAIYYDNQKKKEEGEPKEHLTYVMKASNLSTDNAFYRKTSWSAYRMEPAIDADEIISDPNSNPRIVEGLKVLIRLKEERMKIIDQKRDFMNAFAEIWESCKSVNQLVKKWPPGWDLLDTEHQNRLKAKNSSNTLDKKESEDDKETISKLNTLYAISKIAK